jgi:hypothetical protein
MWLSPQKEPEISKARLGWIGLGWIRLAQLVKLVYLWSGLLKLVGVPPKIFL